MEGSTVSTRATETTQPNSNKLRSTTGKDSNKPIPLLDEAFQKSIPDSDWSLREGGMQENNKSGQGNERIQSGQNTDIKAKSSILPSSKKTESHNNKMSTWSSGVGSPLQLSMNRDEKTFSRNKKRKINKSVAKSKLKT